MYRKLTFNQVGQPLPYWRSKGRPYLNPCRCHQFVVTKMAMARANSTQPHAATVTFYCGSVVGATCIHRAHLTSYVPGPTLRNACPNLHALCAPYHPIRVVRQRAAN